MACYLSDQLNKCKTDKHIYSFLYKIRSKYANKEEDISKLSKGRFIGQLASFLGKRVELRLQSDENFKIIEVSLSILANCTYNNKTAVTQVYDANIIEYVMTIINKIDNPSLVSKCCRLLGNLSVQNEKIGLNFQQAGAALSLSNCLSEKNTFSLLTMSLRAIRILWSSKKFRYEILSFGTIFKIFSCLKNVLQSELKNVDNEKEPSSSIQHCDMVILKRESEPDRLISKEKLSSILTKMEKHTVETKYEILRPEKKDPTQNFAVPTSKENCELISEILKLLLIMTSTSTLVTQIAKNISIDGIGIPSLLFLIEECTKFRVSSLKILSNLSYSPQANEFLSVSNELIPTISNLLINSHTLTKSLESNERKYCLEILCLSTENSCNRLKLKRSGVFKTILSIASTTKKHEELCLLIFAIFQYRYDEDSLNIFIQLNLVNILIKIVEELIENMKPDHIHSDDAVLDSERKDEQKLGNNLKRKKSSNNESFNYKSHNKNMRLDTNSPSSSGYGSYQYSPSSDGFSPYNSPKRCYQDYNSDSNEYSPVCSDCSDDEIKEIGKKQAVNDFDIFEYIYGNNEEVEKKGKEDAATLDDLHSEDENESNKAELNSSNKSLENVPETLKSIEADQLHYILLLLWKISINHSDALAFVNSSNLLILIKVFGLVKKPNEKIYQILQNIIEQTRNFVPIFMKQDLVFQLYEASSNIKYDHSDCYSCEKMKSTGLQLLKDFQKVAESGYAEGEMCQTLMQSDMELKRRTAIKLVYVISTTEILNKFLFNYKALDIIIDTILRNDNYLSIAACNGITILSKNLNIRIPCDDELENIIPDDFIDENFDNLESDGELVKFILKDGEISFNKETLKKSSEVFNSMLSSDFKESNNNEVKFSNYTIYGMKYFFHLIIMSNEKRLKSIAPKVNCMSAALQAYELSILYILTNIQLPLLNVIKIILDETNVRNIFEWSITNVNQDLLISSICFYLCGPINGEIKLNLYLDANKSQYSREWKELIFDSILMKCRPIDD